MNSKETHGYISKVAFDGTSRHDYLYFVALSILLNFIILAAFSSTIRVPAQNQFASVTIPVDVFLTKEVVVTVSDESAEEVKSGNLQESILPEDQSINSEDQKTEQPSISTKVPALEFELPDVDVQRKSTSNMAFQYCKKTSSDEQTKSDCIPWSDPLDFENPSEKLNWGKTIQTLRDERDRGVLDSTEKFLLSRAEQRRVHDIRSIGQLTDFRRAGVEINGDPVSSLLGRTQIPDPTWTLREDPIFDLKKLDGLNKAMHE